MDEKPIIFIPADKSYIQFLDYKIEGYGDLESFAEDLNNWKNDKTKEFYNKQINELHNIINNHEKIIREYTILVSSMKETVKLFEHRLDVADDYIESRKENICPDHYNVLKYIINECDLKSTW